MAISLLCLWLHRDLLVSGLGEECVQLACCGQQNQQRGERLYYQPDNQAGRQDNHTWSVSQGLHTRQSHCKAVCCSVWHTWCATYGQYLSLHSVSWCTFYIAHCSLLAAYIHHHSCTVCQLYWSALCTCRACQDMHLLLSIYSVSTDLPQ